MLAGLAELSAQAVVFCLLAVKAFSFQSSGLRLAFGNFGVGLGALIVGFERGGAIVSAIHLEERGIHALRRDRCERFRDLFGKETQRDSLIRITVVKKLYRNHLARHLGAPEIAGGSPEVAGILSPRAASPVNTTGISF